MISLDENCIVFHLENGEGVPCSVENISIEMAGEGAGLFDPDFLKQAAAAVLHYFRVELERDSISVAEFTLAMERILRGFKLAASEDGKQVPLALQSDLRRLLVDAGKGCELFFFPKLRDELRDQLAQSPQTLCFQGIRQCVKQLVGARRWSARCQAMHDQIVEFLRTCLFQHQPEASCSLVVK